jgi:hypothetical protein
MAGARRAFCSWEAPCSDENAPPGISRAAAQAKFYRHSAFRPDAVRVQAQIPYRRDDMSRRLIGLSYQWTITRRQVEAQQLATQTAGAANRGNEVRDFA